MNTLKALSKVGQLFSYVSSNFSKLWSASTSVRASTSSATPTENFHESLEDSEEYVESHVVFGTKEFAAKFIAADSVFIDATFDIVPNLQGAYQFMTVMIEYLGEVSLLIDCNGYYMKLAQKYLEYF